MWSTDVYSSVSTGWLWPSYIAVGKGIYFGHSLQTGSGANQDKTRPHREADGAFRLMLRSRMAGLCFLLPHHMLSWPLI